LTQAISFEKLVRMKKLFLAGFLALSFGLPASADLKIALIDTGKVFDAFYKTKDMAVQIAAKKVAYQKEIANLQAEYDNAEQEADNLEHAVKDTSLSTDVRKNNDAALARKVQDLQSMESELKQMRQTDSDEIKDKLVRSHQEISDQIMKIITDYVSTQGYDLVLDTSASSTAAPALFPYSSVKIIDLTTEIIAKMNALAPSH
jgi:Skp family chaperone for outer membrane proteins